MLMLASSRFGCALLASLALLAPQPFSQLPGPTPPHAEIATNAPKVVVDAGRLTIDVREAPLQLVLAEIQKQAGIAINGTGPLDGLLVTLRLEQLPLDEALRRILSPFDVFLYYAATGDASPPLSAAWIYPKGAGTRLAPVAPEDWASTRELEQGLSDPDPEVRASSLEQLVERKGPRAREALIQALSEVDGYIRANAINSALNAGIELPADQLQSLIVSDTSEDVRRMALESYANHPEVSVANAKAVLEGARSDSSPMVREHAQSILTVLDRSIDVRTAGESAGPHAQQGSGAKDKTGKPIKPIKPAP